MKPNVALTSLLLFAILAALFWKSFVPGWVPASNDGPYGGLVNAQSRQPEAFDSIWADSNWLGSPAPTPGPALSVGMIQPGFFLLLPLAIVGATVANRFGVLKWCWIGVASTWLVGTVLAMVTRAWWAEAMLPYGCWVWLTGSVGMIGFGEPYDPRNEPDAYPMTDPHEPIKTCAMIFGIAAGMWVTIYASGNLLLWGLGKVGQ